MAANALDVQQQAIEVTGQNIANVDTPNYSREQIQLQTSTPLATTLGQQGTGVTATGIEQIRSSLLDSQIPGGISSLSYYNTKSDLMTQVQTSLDQPLSSLNSLSSTSATSTSGGLTDDINNFFSAYQSLSTDPTSSVLRQQVVSSAQIVATALNTIGNSLITTQTQIGTDVTTAVNAANTILANIASLNQQISSVEVGGTTKANDLRDQRQQLVETLSQTFDISTHEESNGSLTVRLGSAQGGTLLVSGNYSGNTASATTVKLAVNGSAPTMALEGWTGGVAETVGNLTAVTQPSAGTVAAQLNVINSVIGDGTTGLVQNYDNIAAGLANLVDTVHQTGFTLQGSPAYNTAGSASFFDNDNIPGNALGTVTARNIQLNSAIAADPTQIAASDTAGQPLNGNLAQTIADLKSNTTAPQLGGQTVSNYYLNTLTSLAANIQSTTNQGSTQQLVNQQLSQQRDSVQGVSLDQETSNLMIYQHAYEASARLMSTIDSMMQTLIQIQ